MKSTGENSSPFQFPRWSNVLLPAIVVAVAGGGLYMGVLIPFGASPATTDVGYAPIQPVPYSHALHVGKLGIDCAYCHTTVDDAAFAAVPPTQTCMNCHTSILPDSPQLQPVWESFNTGRPIEWVKVHDLPDYAYFNHAAHINKGVSCVECHGRVDKMEVVYQSETLSMSWCIDCHRDPGPSLRPREFVTELDWVPPTGAEREAQIEQLLAEYQIKPPSLLTDCSTCHR